MTLIMMIVCVVSPVLEKALADEATFGATLDSWLAPRARR